MKLTSNAATLGRAFAIVFTLALSLSAAPASAQPAGWAYDLARDMMSPFCPGRTLADCPSPQADTLKMWIVVQESAGRTRQDVEDALYERYGDVILAAPRAEGIGIAAYAIPVVAFLGGGGLIVWLLRRLTAQSGENSEAKLAVVPGTRAPDAELERIVEDELARQV